jgi:ESCRT-I complex subunit TSG101
LRAVSHSLAESLRVNAAQSDIAVQSLVSQSRSLHSALATLQGEVSALNSLHATLQSNTAVLQQSIHRADATIADAPPDLPPIDDVLVAPTIVGKQLYDLVAEEQGIQQALYALQAALVKGIIGVDSWSKHTRSLAREALLKRALIRKIGRGMGLEEN